MARFGANLIENNYSVIPIKPGSKLPGKFTGGEWHDYKDWPRHCHRATQAFELQIWDTWPDCAIGIACGLTVGIDIDSEDADLALKIDNLAREILGNTPALRIGRAPKRMLVYRAATPLASRRIGKLNGVEVLGVGRQFVAYGIHPDTQKAYEWVGEDGLADLDRGELPEVTEASLAEFLEKVSPFFPREEVKGGPSQHEGSAWGQAGTVEAIASAMGYIPNNDLHYDDWLEIGLAIRGAIGDQGRDLFLEFSAKSGKDDPKHTANKWDRGMTDVRELGAGTIYRKAQENGWLAPLGVALNPTQEAIQAGPHPAQALLDRLSAPPPPAQPPTPPATPAPIATRSVSADIFDLDGGLKLAVEWTARTAVRPQPMLALGAALATFGVLGGRRYRSPTDLRTNLYILGLAESGSGKDHPRKRAQMALSDAHLEQYIGGSRLVSESGLLSALARHPALVFFLDEFGHFLAGAKHKNASSHKAAILPTMTELFTSAASTFHGAEYADQRSRPRVDIRQPCCCIFGTTAPGVFWEALEHGAMSDGSLARFLIMQVEEAYPQINHEPPLDPPPPNLIEIMKAVVEGAPGHEYGDVGKVMMADTSPEPYTVPYGDGVVMRLRALAEDIDKRQRAGDGEPAVLARIWENTVKVALVRSIARDPWTPEITMRDVEWAIALVGHCSDELLAGAARHISTNETEARVKQVRNIIFDCGEVGITQNELTRKTQGIKGRDRHEIVSTLMEAGEVMAVDVKPEGQGRPGKRFVHVSFRQGLISSSSLH